MVTVCEINKQDISQIAALEQENFSDAWSEKSITDSFERAQSILFGAYAGKRLIGYLIVYYVLDEGEILRIAVEASERRNGAGRYLMLALEEFCRLQKTSNLFLEVRKSNASAIAFYKKQGFRESGIRKNFYTSPAEDAILMSRSLEDN